MNPSLLCATLANLSPVNPVSPAATLTSGMDGDAMAFSRALNDARQSAGNEGNRPAPAAREGESRAADDHGDSSEPAAPGRSHEGTDAPARNGGPSTARPADTARRATGQAGAPQRRDGAKAASAGDTEDTTTGARTRAAASSDDDGSVSDRTTTGRREGVDAAAAESLPGAAATIPAPGERGEGAAHLATHGAAGRRSLTDADVPAAGEQRTGASPRLSSRGGSAADGVAREDGAAGPARPRGASAAARADGAVGAGAAELRAAFADAAAAAAAAAPVAADVGRERSVEAASASGAPLPSAGALLATTATAAHAIDGDAGAVREARLSAPLGSEGFGRELGAQVSFFVREGVQQARLHLNPQELGPVLVRIQLDGQAAQVHMAAELQPTRQALERALPALASQLSEAGLTLTGGGVFEQTAQGFGAAFGGGQDESRGDGTGRNPVAAAGGGATAALAGAAEPGRWSRPRGIVDLIA